MIPNPENNDINKKPENFSEAPTGNASNPSPQNNELGSPGNQLLDDKAEKYLREVASIEDVPDAQDQQEMEDTIRKENSQNHQNSDDK
jgi:hypothetical protein